MSEPYLEKLPATKTSKNNAMQWTPSERPNEGQLVIGTTRSHTTYHLTELETAWPGRAFRLDVIRGGTDPESESYHVFAGVNPADRQCDCKGFAYKGHCKHISAIVDGLLFNNWI